MRNTSTRPLQHKILISIAFALLTSCSHGEEPKTQDRQPLILQGTSSTFGLQAYLRWFNQLAVREDIYAEIDSMGSGQSIRAFLNGTNDFAGTDDPPSPKEIQRAPKGYPKRLKYSRRASHTANPLLHTIFYHAKQKFEYFQCYVKLANQANTWFSTQFCRFS